MADETRYKPFRAYKEKVEQQQKSVFEETPREAPAPQPTPQQTETKDKTMAPTATDKLKAGALRAAQAVKTGTIQGAIGASNREVVNAIEKKLGERYPEILATPGGRKAVEAFIPAMIIMACSFDVENRIPQKHHVETAAQFALTDASAGAVSEMIGFVVGEMFPILAAYAQAGHMLETETVDFSESLTNIENAREVEFAGTPSANELFST